MAGMSKPDRDSHILDRVSPGKQLLRGSQFQPIQPDAWPCGDFSAQTALQLARGNVVFFGEVFESIPALPRSFFQLHEAI